MKRVLSMVLIAGLAMTLLGACGADPTAKASGGGAASAGSASAVASSGAWTPTRDFQGSVMWSAGGVCDSVSRAVAPFTKEALGGKTIVYTNRPGAGGGISTQYVHDQSADGYNLLFGAENPQIAKVMGTSPLDYSNFIPINILCTSLGVVVVAPDSPYNSIQDLIDAMAAKPGAINMATTGPGGLPFTASAMITSVSGVSPNMVTYDGEAACTTAIMGGHSEYTIITVGSCAELIRAGKLKALAVMHNKPLEGFDNIPYITKEIPAYEKFLPWGPFYGVFVREGTPQDVVDYLTEAFKVGAANPEYHEILKGLGCQPANISGQEARDYVDKYRSVSSWLMHEAGAATVSPESVGIPKVE